MHDKKSPPPVHDRFFEPDRIGRNLPARPTLWAHLLMLVGFGQPVVARPHLVGRLLKDVPPQLRADIGLPPVDDGPPGRDF